MKQITGPAPKVLIQQNWAGPENVHFIKVPGENVAADSHQEHPSKEREQNSWLPLWKWQGEGRKKGMEVMGR